MSDELQERQRLAALSASQAAPALAELLLDAAKIAIMVTKDEHDVEILVAINARLEG